ncbi:MAG: Wzz/FepE/Etk N-terminal domain-containing protein, partial [Pirellulales bacterium]|nr:Wzz/FepE/Etk N-terminal domain-containing protein [Pirellulales bacterium]
MSYSGSADGPHVDAMAQIVQNSMRFLQVLWRRKHLLVASCAAAGLLGGLYYTTSKRTFEAEASILIVGSQGDSLDTSLTGGRNDHTAMATYEK